MMQIMNSIALISTVLIGLSGCGGEGDSAPSSDADEQSEVVIPADEVEQEEQNKDIAFFTKELDKSTSIQSLHTDQTILLTMNSLEKTLNEVAKDLNASSIAEIMYQLQYSLEDQVNNVDKFTFNKQTAIIINKQSSKQSLNRNLRGIVELGLMYELDKASRKIIGKDISTTLPDNFSELLDSNEDVNEDNTTQQYISSPPVLSQEITCPPSGVCRRNSPIEEWQKGGLAEVQKIRLEYKKELKEVIVADDVNVTTKLGGNQSHIENARSWSCPSGGYTITAVNYTDNTATIDFESHHQLRYLTRSATSFAPFNYNESFNLEQAPNDNSQNSVCLTDGSWVPSGDSYYSIIKANQEDWASTQSHWEGSSLTGLLDIDNAAQALSILGYKISTSANGPLPSGCGDLACTIIGSPDPDTSPIDPSGRVSMVEISMNNPELSGQDIFNLFRGDAWGTHEQDIVGLSRNWITTLNNLGIINGAAIAQNIRDRWTTGIGQGTFVFRKIEMQHHYTIDLVPVDDTIEELIIIPRQARPQHGSHPTNLFHGTVIPHSLMPFGRPNPHYCAEIDSSSGSYIPVYMVDSDVLIELSKEVEYLTELQLERIEVEKNINIWEQYDALEISNSFGYGSDPLLSYPARIEYNCHNSADFDKNGDAIPTIDCDIKDEAYYDSLIDRLIVLNPTLNGDETNHPCIGLVGNPWISTSNQSL